MAEENKDTPEMQALKAELQSIKDTIATLGKGNKDDNPAPAPQPKPATVLDDVTAAAAQKAEDERKAKESESAIKFNLGLKEFIGKNKDFLTELTPKIHEEIEGRKFTSEVARANSFKKNIIESFFSLKENVEAAPETLKPRIMEFKALADDEKEKQAGKYWDLLELTVDRKALAKKSQEVNKANGGFIQKDDSIKQYNTRFLASKNKYTGETK